MTLTAFGTEAGTESEAGTVTIAVDLPLALVLNLPTAADLSIILNLES